MARFWDTSAIVPCLIEHPHSQGARALARDDVDVVVFQFTPTEVVSAFTKTARIDRWTDDDMKQALRRLDALAARWTLVAALDKPAIDDMVGRARALMLKHPLASMDALQLAAALTYFDPPHRNGFVAADRALAAAASAEGLVVFRPETPKRGGRQRR